MAMSDTYIELCGTCGIEREIEICWFPAEKSSYNSPGSDEDWSWGDTLAWCECDETGAELDAMVARCRDETMKHRDTIYFGERYARGYDDL